MMMMIMMMMMLTEVINNVAAVAAADDDDDADGGRQILPKTSAFATVQEQICLHICVKCVVANFDFVIKNM